MNSISPTCFSILALAVVLICSLQSTEAFSVSSLVVSKRQTTAALGVTTTTTKTVEEDDALYSYNKAREFAFRDDFGITKSSEYDQHYHPLSDEVAEIEEAKKWLSEIVAVQSGCATGTLAGADLCENQDEAAEIVARLRRKIEAHEQRVAVMTRESESIVPTIATELIFGALFVVLFMFWTTLDLGQRHDDIPSMSNYQDWLSVLQEKGYILSLFQGTGPSV